MSAGPALPVYRLLTSREDQDACLDIPQELCPAQPANFVRHVVSLTATKTGDGVADPKLVLAWLLGALGAPGWQVGLLVPVREALALLPQLLIAGWIRRRPRRKWVWAAASLGQGIAVAGMAAAVLLLDGAAAGAGILGALAVFALFRSAASVSYKDVLGKTVSKTTRGTATGAAASAAAALVFLFGLLVSTGVLPLRPGAMAGALAAAASLWFLAAVVFATLEEIPAPDGGEGPPLKMVVAQLGLLRRDPQLVRFILVRGLLLATALAPPYILALAGRGDGGGLGSLGPFVIAASAAAVSSAWIWGRVADRSSRRVLARAALLASLPLGVISLAALSGASWLSHPAVLPLLLFVLMVAYQGVRIGRSTHIVDMATQETRAAYVALSNTAIGLLLVVGGVFGVLAEVTGEGAVLGIFALLCLAAAAGARGLEEVQRGG